jgi:kynurenine formamidase
VRIGGPFRAEPGVIAASRRKPMVSVPDYDDLPLNAELGMRHAWGVFGKDDQLGTLNHLTPVARVAASTLIKRGVSFNLSLPLNLPDPPLFRRKPYEHHIVPLGRNEQDDYVDQFYLQASSQWDGFRHVAAREFGYYNGTPAEDVREGGARLGVERFAEHGLFGRAVLIDVERFLAGRGTRIEPLSSYAIRAEELEAARVAQGVSIEAGDILLIRTGWMAGYLASDAEGRTKFAKTFAFPGLYAGEETARYLWNLRIAAVAADNPALEVAPGDKAAGSLHRRILPMLGLPIGELFNFESLAADCRQDGRYQGFFASNPLSLPGGVASPANAAVLK